VIKRSLVEEEGKYIFRILHLRVCSLDFHQNEACIVEEAILAMFSGTSVPGTNTFVTFSP
jgi:hypothetical protein